MSEKTFVDPIHDGTILINDVRSDLDDMACAARSLGMGLLADRLNDAIECLFEARKLIDEGRDMALKAYVGGAEQATANMVNAAIAVADND